MVDGAAYGDAQLNGLMQEALAGSPTLAVAQARVRKAEAATATVRSRGLPNVSGNAGVEQAKQSYNIGIPAEFVPQGYNDYGRLTLDFNWELDFWGKNRAAVAAAVSDARAAEADAAEARLMLSTNVAAACTPISPGSMRSAMWPKARPGGGDRYLQAGAEPGRQRPGHPGDATPGRGQPPAGQGRPGSPRRTDRAQPQPPGRPGRRWARTGA